jgi:SNF family Na+-dependent transporter
VFLSEVFTSWVLLLLVVALILASFSYSYYGSSITKYLDALTRNLVTIGKISLAWLIGILITIASSSPDLKLESLDWRQILFKVIGFTISAIGTLIYTQIILKKTFTHQTE